jgi:DNA-binding NtrC family response regulator
MSGIFFYYLFLPKLEYPLKQKYMLNQILMQSGFYNLYVAADSKLYAESLKQSLETSFDENVKVKAFNSKEECIEKIDKDVKPDIVVLDYELNKRTGTDPSHTVDRIKEISPETVVIMMSDEEDMESALKALRYGAYDYVMKDRFAFSHIKASVKKCLEPSRV